MHKYKATVEYAQKDKHDEQAMLEAEQQAFLQAIPYLRGKEFKRLSIDTNVIRYDDKFDLSAARCTVELEEA